MPVKKLILVLLMLTSIRAFATNWFVDPVNGGPAFTVNDPSHTTRATCTGNGNTPFNAAGSPSQACPYADARNLWEDFYNGSPTGAWVIAAGDVVTLICTSANPCQISGSANSSAPGDPCFGIGTACFPPDMPSGTSGSHITIQGSNHAACTTTGGIYNNPGYSRVAADPAQVAWIWGGDGTFFTLQMHNTQYVDMSCIAITDHSSCGVSSQPNQPTCGGTDFSSYGIYRSGGTPGNGHVTLTNMLIEGLQAKGIIGPIGGPWTYTNVEISFNGQTGEDFDDGAATPSNGTPDYENAVVAFNGCAMVWPITGAIPITPYTCSGQSNGGQGDGIGTPVTSNLNIIFNHSWCLYNVQDCVDWGHTWGATNVFTNSFFIGNNGGTIKVGPSLSLTVYNNLIDEGCSRMQSAMTGAPSTYNANLGDFCRANTAMGTNVWAQGSAFVSSTASNLAISCTAANPAVCTATGPVNLTIGEELIPDTSDPTTWANTVATTCTNCTSWTMAHAYPNGFSGTYMVIVPTTPSSPSVIKIYHNTIFSYAQGNDLQCQVGVGVQQGQVNVKLCNGYSIDNRDNIYNMYQANGNPQPVIFPEEEPTISDYNVCYNTLGSICSSLSETHSLTTSPLFTGQPVTPVTVESNLDNPNFNLSSSSPAKAAGVVISGQTTDYLGNAWNASTPSMGAIQFSGVAAVATPTAAPAAGTYTGTQSVVLSTSTSGATICYTTNGTTPAATTPGTCSTGTTYTTAISVAASQTIQALGTLSGDTNSSVASFAYVINTSTVTTYRGGSTFSQTVSH